MKFGLNEEIVLAIKHVLMRYPGVEQAKIFGSRARGDFKNTSDIDIAVYFVGELPPRLSLDIEEAAGIYKVDVVDMNNLHNEKLRQRIEEQGLEIYASKGD